MSFENAGVPHAISALKCKPLAQNRFYANLVGSEDTSTVIPDKIAVLNVKDLTGKLFLTSFYYNNN